MEMIKVTNEIEIFQGDNYDAEVTVLDKDGDAVGIDGAAIIFSVMEDVNSTKFIIQRKNTAAGGNAAQIEDTDLGNGKFKLHLTPTETEITVQDYIYDFEITIAGKVYTIIKDIFSIVYDVT